MPPSASLPTIRRHGVVAVAVATCLVGLPASPAAAATPTVGGAGTFATTEQTAAIDIGTGVTVAGGSTFDGAWVEFEVTGADGNEQLALATDGSAATGAGVVSIVGTDIHLGDGSGSIVVGSVDGTLDGADGAALRVAFVDPSITYANAGFESTTAANWLVENGRIDLGTTSVAGCTSVDTSTYPGASRGNDDTAPLAGVQSASVSSAYATPEGSWAMLLELGGVQPDAPSDVVHGPAVSSASFTAPTGTDVSFQWMSRGGEAHHVLAYLLADGCGGQTELLDSFGTSNADTAWTTVTGTVPSAGAYRLVFVAGSYDVDADGTAANTRVLVDDLEFSTPRLVTDAVVQAVARRLTYAYDGDAPPASQSVTVTARNDEANSGDDTITVDLTAEDDLPSFPPPADLVVANTEPAQSRSDLTGTYGATDPDDEPLTYALDGAETGSWVLGATTYTERVVTTYGTLHLVPATGGWRFVHDDPVIEAKVDADDSVSVDVDVTDGTTTLVRTQTVVIDVDLTVAAAPEMLRVTSGDRRVALTWDAPDWIGAQPVTGYRIEVSDDAGASWTDAVTDTASTSTSGTVTELVNGTEYSFRVSTVNGSGTGPSSATATTTPRRNIEDPVDTIEGSVGPGGTLSTDPDAVGPTEEQPVTTSVTSPSGGEVAITLAPPSPSDDVDGFAARARTIRVSAPSATAAQPLSISVRGDAAALPGTARGRLLVLFDGTAVLEECVGDGAAPDPCIATRGTADDGDLLVEIRSSEPGTLTLAEPTHACPDQLAPDGAFADVGGDAVDCVAWWRPGTGTGDGVFGATEGLSRGQVATLVADLLAAGGLALPDGGSGDGAFIDLELTAHRREILSLVELGVLSGYGDGTFRPGQTLSRQELALVLVRVAELLEGGQLASGAAGQLDDLGSGSLAETVRRAVAAGLADARSDGSFDPAGRVRRGEGAAYLVRLLDRLVADGALDLPVD